MPTSVFFQMSPQRFTVAHWAICVLRAITWVFAASLLAKISSHCLIDLLEKNMHPAFSCQTVVWRDHSFALLVRLFFQSYQTCPISPILSSNPCSVAVLFVHSIIRLRLLQPQSPPPTSCTLKSQVGPTLSLISDHDLGHP